MVVDPQGRLDTQFLFEIPQLTCNSPLAFLLSLRTASINNCKRFFSSFPLRRIFNLYPQIPPLFAEPLLKYWLGKVCDVDEEFDYLTSKGSNRVNDDAEPKIAQSNV